MKRFRNFVFAILFAGLIANCANAQSNCPYKKLGTIAGMDIYQMVICQMPCSQTVTTQTLVFNANAVVQTGCIVDPSACDQCNDTADPLGMGGGGGILYTDKTYYLEDGYWGTISDLRLVIDDATNTFFLCYRLRSGAIDRLEALNVAGILRRVGNAPIRLELGDLNVDDKVMVVQGRKYKCVVEIGDD